jgi:hypothetical protein
MAAGGFSRHFLKQALFQFSLSVLLISSSYADNSVLQPQPNFTGIPGGGVTANAGNCFLGDASAAQGAIGGASALNLSALGVKKKAASATAVNSCGATAVPDASSISCDSTSVQTGGNFDPQKLQLKIDGLLLLDGGSKKSSPGDEDDEDVTGGKTGSLTCELNEFGTIKQEMACVQNQGQLLAQQIGSLAQIYQQNITRFQKDDQAYKQREGDRQSQLDAIQKLLGGNKNSGTKGLLGEQADLQKLVNDTMPQDIAKALSDQKVVANQRAVILENIQKHTMSLTGDCFKTNAKAGYKCTPGGPDLSPENYIVCMYGKYAHVKNGQYVQGALADSNATSAQNTLQGILDQMTSMTSLSWSTPTDPTSAAATAQKPSYGNTIQDLINNFVSKTNGMTVNGISVATTITNELQSCYLSAQAEVASERTDPSSAISQAQFQQTQSETAMKAGFDQKLEQYSQKWTEAMGVLSAQNLPLNLTNCKSQDITYEGNCLTDVQNQITGLLKGDASQAPFTMNVPAQFPDTQIPTTALQCRGINGCVTQLQAVNDQVTQAKTTLTTGREAYETQARQSTDQFTQQVAALLNNQSSQLRKQLASINSNLQGLGVSGNIGFPNVQGKPMEYETNQDGSQGLPKMPSDVMALISGKMSPPMMDLTDNSNNDGSALAGGVKKVQENLQKVQTVRSKWESLESECGKDMIKSKFKSAVQNITQCSNICDAVNNSLSPNQTQIDNLIAKGDATSLALAATLQNQTTKVSKTFNTNGMLSSTLTAVENSICKGDDGSSLEGCAKLSDSASQTLISSETNDLVSALTTGCSTPEDSTTINGNINCNEINGGGSKRRSDSTGDGSSDKSTADKPQ